MTPKNEAPPKKIPPMEELYTPAEVAAPLRVKERVVLELLRSGKLRGVKVGKAWRIRASDLEAFMSESGKREKKQPK